MREPLWQFVRSVGLGKIIDRPVELLGRREFRRLYVKRCELWYVWRVTQGGGGRNEFDPPPGITVAEGLASDWQVARQLGGDYLAQDADGQWLHQLEEVGTWIGPTE